MVATVVPVVLAVRVKSTAVRVKSTVAVAVVRVKPPAAVGY